MAFVPGREQPACRLPDLGRVVVPELVGDDLVERDVEVRAHRLSIDHKLVLAALDRPSEVRMLRKDQQVPVVGVGGVEERNIETFESTAPPWAREAATLSLGARREVVHACIFASWNSAPTQGPMAHQRGRNPSFKPRRCTNGSYVDVVASESLRSVGKV